MDTIFLFLNLVQEAIRQTCANLRKPVLSTSQTDSSGFDILITSQTVVSVIVALGVTLISFRKTRDVHCYDLLFQIFEAETNLGAAGEKSVVN